MTENRFRSSLSVISDVASILTAGLVVLVVTMAAIASYARMTTAGPTPTAEARRENPARTAPAGGPVSSVAGLSLPLNDAREIPEGAETVIVEFSDLQCPYCGQHERDVYPLIKSKLVDTGKVAYLQRHFPVDAIHPQAFHAAEAVECAREQGKYTEMRSRLFASQTTLGEPALREHAVAVGLDVEGFDACLGGDRAAAAVQRHQLEGRRLGVRGTPTFFIGRVRANGTVDLQTKILGSQPYETFADSLRSAGSVQ